MDQKTKLISVGVIVVVLVVVLGFISPSLWKGKAPTAQPGGPQPVYAPKGELTPGFPKELILDSSAQVSQSYSITYSASTHQYTANFLSSQSLTALHDEYKAYFQKNGWTIVSDAAPSKISRSIYATKGAGITNLLVIDQGKARQVILSYLPV